MNKLAKSLHTVTAAYNVANMLRESDSQYSAANMDSARASQLAQAALEVLGYAEPFYSDPHGLKEQITAKIVKAAKAEHKAVVQAWGIAG